MRVDAPNVRRVLPLRGLEVAGGCVLATAADADSAPCDAAHTLRSYGGGDRDGEALACRSAPATEGEDVKLKSTIVATALLLLATSAGAAWAAYSWVVRDQTTVTTASNRQPEVKILQGVDNLTPGSVVPMRVQVRNPNSYPVRVLDVEGHTPKSASGCQSHAVAIVKKTPQELRRLIVPAEKTMDLAVKVEMKDWAGPRCAGLRLSMEVVVKAEQAS